MRAYAYRSGKIGCFVLLALTLLLLPARAVNVVMQYNNLARTGANTSETILTPTNVATSFGQLFENPVDGQSIAQPLYVQNVSISNGVHNVVYICTENNSVYAFDADMPGVTYWVTNFGTPFNPSLISCGDLSPACGITGTPVIDPTTGTLYVDTKLLAGSAHKLHALDLITGQEKFGGPVTVTTTGFNSEYQHQRPGLLLLSNVVYVCFGSHCDHQPSGGTYHGYIIAYNATNLTQQMYSFNTTPNGSEGAIWSGGMAPAVDTNGNIYVMTGNGTFDGITNNDYAMSFIKLSPSLAVEDYATPSNFSSLSGSDLDLGSGGPVLIPPNYVVGIGKEPTLYMANINNMGHTGNFAQSFTADASEGDTVGKSPVYWQGPSMQYLFLMHASNPTESFQFTGSSINTTPLGTASYSVGDRAGGISLSANGNANGILWEIDDDSNMRAYDAVNFPKLLWTGSVGSYVKMNCPTVANGKVYVGTANDLYVFGLTNYLYLQAGSPTPVLSWAAGGKLLQSTNLPSSWTTNPSSSPYTIVPTNNQMFYRLQVP